MISPGRGVIPAEQTQKCPFARHFGHFSVCSRNDRTGALPMTTTEVSDEDFQEILAQTRTFVRTAVVPREQEILADDRVPDDLREQAKKMGLFGYAIPQQWGGLGLNLAQDVELAMELGYTSLALRSMFGTNNGIAGQVLVGFGTDEQKARWLEPMATGDVVASFALTEPGAGSNPSGLRTKAVRDGSGDDWVINGQKRFITNAPTANLFIVFARTRPADDDGAGIAVFLVPADAAGVVVGAKDAKMGQEGAWTSDVSFDDVRVPAAALIGGSEDIGYRAAMISLARGRVHIAALAVGTAQRALDESVAYAATATQGGTPIGNFQLVQAMIADQQTGVLAGRALVRDTARSWVSGEDRRIAPSAAKLFCTEMVGQVADLAVQIHGGSGYMREVPVERIYRDVRLLRLYEGTSEIQRLIIGANLVKTAQRESK
jgi:acyl-CoA dehydrogenase